MTYGEAANNAIRLTMTSLRVSVWEEALNLIEEGHDPDEAVRTALAGINSDEAVEVLLERTRELTRSLLDPRAPERLQ